LIYSIPFIGDLMKKYDEFEMPAFSLSAITSPLTTFWTFITSLFSPKNWQGAIGALSPSGLYGSALDESKLAAARKPRSMETPEPSAPPQSKVENGALLGGGLAIAAAAMPEDGLNNLHYVFIGTLVVIILGGAFLSYYRAKNDRTEQDDSPPEPGVFRSADSKGHPA
jgi:hypothetical protein